MYHKDNPQLDDDLDEGRSRLASSRSVKGRTVANRAVNQRSEPFESRENVEHGEEPRHCVELDNDETKLIK